MDLNRQPYQGVLNIVRFNWHFYLIAGGVLVGIVLFYDLLPSSLRYLALGGVLLALLTLAISLLVSYYVYDISDLYELNWLEAGDGQSILNINAGFDETSAIIRRKFPRAKLTICDFYDSARHTEVSIRSARKAYPPEPGTIAVDTEELPFADQVFDRTLAILSAHEIRDPAERVHFFRELARTTKPAGRIYVTEHLRDINNFLAYTIGFLHFHSRRTWLDTFERAGLRLEREVKTTPFITTFVLTPHGSTL